MTKTTKNTKVKVECNRCHKKFKLKLEIEKLEDGIEKIYFSCPKCKKVYPCYYTDEPLREMMEKQRECFKNGNVEEYKEIKERVSKYMDELKEKMDESTKG